MPKKEKGSEKLRPHEQFPLWTLCRDDLERRNFDCSRLTRAKMLKITAAIHGYLMNEEANGDVIRSVIEEAELLPQHDDCDFPEGRR